MTDLLAACSCRNGVVVLISPGNGMHWNTIWSSEDDFTMGHILLMLLVDIIIYSMFTWYLDAVISDEFGTPQPFYFPFTVGIIDALLKRDLGR